MSMAPRRRTEPCRCSASSQLSSSCNSTRLRWHVGCFETTFGNYGCSRKVPSSILGVGIFVGRYIGELSWVLRLTGNFSGMWQSSGGFFFCWTQCPEIQQRARVLHMVFRCGKKTKNVICVNHVDIFAKKKNTSHLGDGTSDESATKHATLNQRLWHAKRCVILALLRLRLALDSAKLLN